MSGSVIVSKGHSRPLAELSFVQDPAPGRSCLLVSACHDKQPQVRHGETGAWIGSFIGHKGAVWSTKIDAFTRTLAVTASGDFTARLWCVTTGKELCELKHKHVVKSVDFSPDSNLIVSGCQDGLLRIFQTSRPDASPLEVRAAADVNDAVTKCLWSTEADGLLYVAKRSGVVEVWDSRDGSSSPAMSTVISAGQPVMDIELSDKHGQLTVACGAAVTVLSSADLSVRMSIPCPDKMHFKDEGGASLHPDGSRIIAGGSDLWLREFDVCSGSVLRTFKGHHGPVRCVRYHPTGDTVASGSEDATIRIWDLSPEAGES